MKKDKKDILFLSILMLSGAIIRILYTLLPEILDADNAVFALMAKYISEFKEFPVYMWLSHYSGCLCSYLGAALFKIFGVSPLVYGYAGVIFSCAWMILSSVFLRKTLDRSGYIPAMLFVVLPPSNVLFYSLLTGWPAEMLVFGTLLMIFLAKYIREDRHRPYIFMLLGILSGMGLWLSLGITPLLLTVFTVFLIKDRRAFFSRAIAVFALSFMIGYLPAIIYNIQYPEAFFMRMAGRILDLDRSVLGYSDLKWIVAGRILRRLSDIPVFLAEIPALIYTLMGAVNAALFFAALALVLRKNFTGFLKNKKPDIMAVSAIFVFWFTIFYVLLVDKDRTRYMLPLYAVAPLLIGNLFSYLNTKSRFFYGVLIIAVVLYNCCDIGNHFLNRKFDNYSELAKWLEAKEIRYGYSDYHTSYIVVFRSNEKILISPTLFHPTFSDRRLQYTSKVRGAANPAYIVRTSAYPRAEAKMDAGLKKLGVRFKKDAVKEFLVYHSFTRKTYPEELSGVLNEN